MSGMEVQTVGRYTSLALLTVWALLAVKPGAVCEEAAPVEQTESQTREDGLSHVDAWLYYDGEALPMARRKDAGSLRWRRNQPVDSPAIPALPDRGGVPSKNLSRLECVKLVLQHNHDLALSRMRWEVRKWGVR